MQSTWGINKHANCEKYGKVNNIIIESGLKDVNFNNIDKPENWFHDVITMLLPEIDVKSYFLQFIIILFSLVLSLFIISDLLNLDDRKSKKLKETHQDSIEHEINLHFEKIITLSNNQNTFLNDINEHTLSDPIDECDLLKMKKLRLQNTKKIIMGHLNINSIPNKFDGIMDVIKEKLDIFLISETKIDDSFPEAQFFYNGYSLPHRRDRAIGAGGLLLYVNENIPSKKLKGLNLPDDVEILCVEINLKKQKWLIIGIYNPPNMNNDYFFEYLSNTIDLCMKKYNNIVIMGDFNLEPCTEIIETFCHSYDFLNLVKEKTCFKGPPKCYDLILTNCKNYFQNTEVITTGFSDFHKMTITILKTEYIKAEPIQIVYRNYKKYNPMIFCDELRNKLNQEPSSYVDYNKFQTILCSVLNKHAPIKNKYLRANDSPFITKDLRKLIMNRSRFKNVYIKNKTAENWENYRKLRNECVKMTKKAKKRVFQQY